MLSSHYAEQATYDSAGLDPYTSSGAGASMLWFNQSSTAAKDIDAGLELFVNYGPSEQQLTMYILFVFSSCEYLSIMTTSCPPPGFHLRLILVMGWGLSAGDL